VNSPKAACGVAHVVASHTGSGFVNSQTPIFSVPAHAGPDGPGGAGTPAQTEEGHTGPPVGKRRAISDWRADRLTRRVYPLEKAVLRQLRHPCPQPVDGG